MTTLKWTAAALVALLASPAFPYHDTLGGGASIAGDAMIGVILPIVVVVVLLLVGVGMWGRKKRQTKSTRRMRREGRLAREARAGVCWMNPPFGEKVLNSGEIGLMPRI